MKLEVQELPRLLLAADGFMISTDIYPQSPPISCRAHVQVVLILLPDQKYPKVTLADKAELMQLLIKSGLAVELTETLPLAIFRLKQSSRPRAPAFDNICSVGLCDAWRLQEIIVYKFLGSPRK